MFYNLNVHEDKGEGGEGSDVNDVDEAFARKNFEMIEITNVGLKIGRLLELQAKFETKDSIENGE